MSEKINTDIAEMIHSHAWEQWLAHVRQRKEVYEQQLLSNAGLDESDRKAYVLIRRELKGLFESFYKQGGTTFDTQLGLA